MTSKDYLRQYVETEAKFVNPERRIKNLSVWLADYTNTEMVINTIAKSKDFDCLTSSDIVYIIAVLRNSGKEIFDFNFADVLYVHRLLSDPVYVSMYNACEAVIHAMAEMPVNERKMYFNAVVVPQTILKESAKKSIKDEFTTLLFYADGE